MLWTRLLKWSALQTLLGDYIWAVTFQNWAQVSAKLEQRKRRVCACVYVHVCSYTHQYGCTAEVMFALRKYSMKVQDCWVVSIVLNERGTGSNLTPEAECQWLLQLVKVSSPCSNFTLQRRSWSGDSTAREWVDNSGMWMIRSPVLEFTAWSSFSGHSHLSLCTGHTQVQVLALCFGSTCLM